MMQSEQQVNYANYLAIAWLAAKGHNISAIADLLGLHIRVGPEQKRPNKAFIAFRIQLSCLPEFIRAEYRKLFLTGPNATPVRFANIAYLYKAYNQDYIDHPDGDGPELQAAWRKVMA